MQIYSPKDLEAIRRKPQGDSIVSLACFIVLIAICLITYCHWYASKVDAQTVQYQANLENAQHIFEDGSAILSDGSQVCLFETWGCGN